MRTVKRPRCVVKVQGPTGPSVIVGPFSSWHMAGNYEARLRKLASKNGTHVSTQTVDLEAPPITPAKLREWGVIGE